MGNPGQQRANSLLTEHSCVTLLRMWPFLPRLQTSHPLAGRKASSPPYVSRSTQHVPMGICRFRASLLSVMACY